MTLSQNGWRANDRSLVSSRLIPGTTTKVTIRNGPAGDLLLEVASLFDRLVQDIDPPPLDDWGYAERPVRGSTAISNHASGTAIDLNATRWPLGSMPSKNLNPDQIATVQRIVKATNGAVRWGGNYTGRKDPMHFEISDNRTEADCARALTALRAAFAPKPNAKEDDVSAQDVWGFQVHDNYTTPPTDTMTAGAALEWATAHAARAKEAAEEAVQISKDNAAKLDQILARLDSTSTS
jgi:hypothetical protein